MEGREEGDGRGKQLAQMLCCGGVVAAGFSGGEGAVLTCVTFFLDPP